MTSLLFFFLFTAAALFPVYTAHAQCCYTEMDFSGTWKSAGSEDQRDGSFGFREIRFTEKTWTRMFTRYADKARRKPLYIYTAEGTYTVNEASPKVRDAYNTAFRTTKRTLMLLSSDEASVKRYGLDSCGLRKGVPKDISGKGCKIYRSVKEYPVEFDLSKRDKGSLFLGLRPADENLSSEERRPTVFSEPLMLVSGVETRM